MANKNAGKLMVDMWNCKVSSQDFLSAVNSIEDDYIISSVLLPLKNLKALNLILKSFFIVILQKFYIRLKSRWLLNFLIFKSSKEMI